MLAGLQGCTVNFGVNKSDEVMPAEQDFIACQMWFEGLPEVRLDTSQMSTEATSRTIKILEDRLAVLQNVNSTLAMQVRGLQEEMLEDFRNIQRGVMSTGSSDRSGMIEDCEKVLGISR